MKMCYCVHVNDTECGNYPLCYCSEDERSKAIASFAKNHPDWTFTLLDPVPCDDEVFDEDF